MGIASIKALPGVRRAGRRIVVAAALAGVSVAAHATDYSEGRVVTSTYVDPNNSGTSGTCTRAAMATTTTCTAYTEVNDLRPSPVALPAAGQPEPNDTPTNIGALTLGGNFITGSTIPYGPVANTMTGELAYQDFDYLTFTIPTGQVLSNLYLVAPSTAVPDGTVIMPGDQFFIGLAKGSGINVTLPSSAGLLAYTLVSSGMVGSDILPGLGASSPPGFSGPPFSGGPGQATGFSGSLGAGTYTLFLLDGDKRVDYKLDLQTTAVPEPATWAMMLAGFGAVGLMLRRRPVGAARLAA